MTWETMLTKLSEIATVASFCCTLPITLIGLCVAFMQLRDIKKQLKQTTSHILTTISNEHNWILFERHADLPPAIPSWADLSDTNKGWAWRTLLLNHLNLLHLAYQDYQAKLIDDAEFKFWQRKAKFWFQDLAKENSDPVIAEGRKVLRQLLSQQEAGYSDKFRLWLADTAIIPASLIWADTETNE